MNLRPDKHTLSGAAILAAVACLIALTWFGTIIAIRAERVEALARVSATIANQALTFSEQVSRQLLALDQSLRSMVRAWEADPKRFNLEDKRAEATVLTGISRDMLLVDELGIIRQSSVPEAIGQNVSDRDFFTYARDHGNEPSQVFIGPASIDTIMRQWHLNVASWMHHPDGSFAGAIAADYRVSAILDVFREANVGSGGIVALIGLTDGRLRANFGPTDADPDTAITDTPMFAAIKASNAGTWIGPSSTDAVRRIHAFRRLANRDLMIVVAMDEQEAMRPADVWRRQADVFAGCITALLLVMAAILVRGTRQARAREQALADDRAVLAGANAQLEVAKAHADAKTEQLEATLAGMTDGVAMMDPQFCLVEWNARFPQLAGVPPELLRVGLPMEEILRAQARAGQFGEVDVDTEVNRRMVVLRTGRFGTTERPRPDGRTLELRRNRLPDGGFVTLYSDITEHKRAENALREARAMAENANAAKSRFVAVVSHEIRTPLNALLNTLRLLRDGDMAPSERALVEMARQSGDALSGLINDILEMSRMEAGQLTLRESVFALRPMLEGALEMFHAQAEERGITLRLAIDDNVPDELSLDPGRLRQVLLNLLSNAVKFANAGDVALVLERDHDAEGAHVGLRIEVRDRGPVIPLEDRQRLFRPFSRLDRPEGDEKLGTGLGLAICLNLVTLMGGQIGCEPWSWVDETGAIQEGNAFWITLPGKVLVTNTPAPAPHAAAQPPALEVPKRPLPRTRILLVEDVPANQIVTAILLRRVGHTVDVVPNGEAAIRAVDRTPYDLVFMDIFMPGMSGQEAAHHIRRLRGAAGQVPIIALTANVAPEDEAIFRAAGMNGIQGKPVSLPELLSVLAKHVWAGHPAGETPARGEDEEAAEAPPAILSMDRINELRTNLPPEMLAKLVEDCLTDLQERMLPFRRALQSKVAPEITAQAHTMAGMAAAYGLSALETKLREIMGLARAGNVDAFGSAFDEAAVELTRAAIAVREALQNEMA